VGGITWFFRAPAAYYGDRSSYYGGNLSFDQLQFDTSAQYDDRDIILTGGGVTIWYDFPNNPGTSWTAYSTVLNDTGGWKFGAFASPVPATATQIQTVLADLTDFQIRGEYRSGADTGELDNFCSCPSRPVRCSWG
jgi:alkaline phosphatase D